jgi:cytochrome c
MYRRSNSLTIIAALIGGLLPAQLAIAAVDPANGAQVFKKCAACHSTDAGVNKVGPSLAGVIGRAAGSVAGYAYSPAVKAAATKGLVWTEEALAAYLENPRKYLSETSGDASLSNKMPFALADAQQRADVAAYLKSLVTP